MSIQYQTYHELKDIEKPELRIKIEQEGWSFKFLSYQKPDGHWEPRFYQPK